MLISSVNLRKVAVLFKLFLKKHYLCTVFCTDMDVLQEIRKPIEREMNQYRDVFDSYLVHTNPLLQQVLSKIGERKGKMMRPLLTLLCAKLFGEVNDNTILTAATFEFFHTASLVHDDVVDESEERRGQMSVNRAFGNQVAVLSGDFILANALLCASKTGSSRLVEIVSIAAQNLSNGELLQLNNVANQDVTEDVYFDIIKNKTAALFAACAEAGVMSVNGSEKDMRILHEFGEIIGICFQIRDDIFDYNDDAQIGKPTGNDMKEGKLTLPVIHALLSTGDAEMLELARKVKMGDVSSDEVSKLVEFTKENGGIDYAVKVMTEYAEKAKSLLSVYPDSDVKKSLELYVDFVIDRAL